MKTRFFYGLYNLSFLLLLPFFLLFLLGVFVFQPAYRRHMGMRFGIYPAGFFERLRGGRRFWIHAASVGEVIMSRPFVRALRERYPEALIAVSTITPTGRAAAQGQLPEADLCFYFPFDFFWIVPGLLEKLKPALLILMETELWPNCLRSLARRKIPAVLVNGRISNKSFPRYLRFRPFIACVLESLPHYLMQSQSDADRIVALGAAPGRVEVTGNMKYDQGLDEGRPSADRLREKLGLAEDDVVMIAGSTRPGEEAAVLEAYLRLRAVLPALVLMIAPRHLHRLAEIERLLAERGLTSIRKSAIAGDFRREDGVQAPVILIDTMGELGRLYPFGRYIFIGGSLAPLGGQNPLEAAACRKPVFFGPHMDNFKEIAAQLLAVEAAIQVADGADLGEKMLRLHAQPEDYEKKAEAAYQVVLKHRGAVERNLAQIATLIESGNMDGRD